MDAWGNFKHGLFFGMGFLIAYAALKLIAMLLLYLVSHAGPGNAPQLLP